MRIYENLTENYHFYYKNFASGFRRTQRQKKGISGILYLIVISLILTSPSGFSNLPTRLERAILLGTHASAVAGIFGLAAHKVYLRDVSPHHGVSSYLTFSPLPLRAVIFCGTCCRCLQRLPVRKYGALCCPDFPHADLRQPATTTFQGAKIQKSLNTTR